jgi:uncharacterized YigZ family protein
MDKIKIIAKEHNSLITIKGSKFQSYTHNVKSRNDVDDFLAAKRKEHYKATHICYAYRIGTDNIIEFSTDAGEPSGTAGKPILGVIQKYELTNTLVIVIRYFGGTKLGVRGLIDAYHDSAEEVVKDTPIKTLWKVEKLNITLTYSNLSTIEYNVRHRNGIWLNANYESDSVIVTIAFLSVEYESQKKWLNDMIGTKQITSIDFIGLDWIEVNNS